MKTMGKEKNKIIALRLPPSLIENIKKTAEKNEVPMITLMKLWLKHLTTSDMSLGFLKK